MKFYRDLSEPGTNIYFSHDSELPIVLDDTQFLCPDCSTPRIDGQLVLLDGKPTIKVKYFWHDYDCLGANRKDLLSPLYRRCPFPEGFVILRKED